MLKFIKANNELFSLESLKNVRNEQGRVELTFHTGLCRIDGLDLDKFINALNEANKENLFVLDLDEVK